jgi:uncharacterized protein (TIGR02271 family)
MAFDDREEQLLDNGDHVVIPLYGEEFSVAKKQVATGRVKVATITDEREQLVEQALQNEHVELERVPIGHVVAEIPEVRTEGDTTIIPVVEEAVVVQRQLVLKEEVRIRRVRETQNYQGHVVLRQQEAVVTRIPADNNPAVAIAAQTEKT